MNLQSNYQKGERALAQGTWVKLICGASNQDLASIADLCAIYATAGVHCIDLAADPAVVYAARKALHSINTRGIDQPWIMVSISDGEDAHFRKASFDPRLCPDNCSRPCQKICPAYAISNTGGVNEKKCYGCGRCIGTCPIGIINEKSQYLKTKDLSPMLKELNPDAIEIHTAPGRLHQFKSTVKEIMKSNISCQRIAVSCGLQATGIKPERLAEELWDRYEILRVNNQRPLWQLDGKQMSGDLGPKTSKAVIKLWEKMVEIAPPGPIQLAGGTNQQTIKYLPQNKAPAGIAFGGMARKIIQPWLLEAQAKEIPLIEWPEGWEAALEAAKQLINPWIHRNNG